MNYWQVTPACGVQDLPEQEFVLKHATCYFQGKRKMRRFFIAGNWKMNPAGNPLPLLSSLKAKLAGMDSIDLMIAPPFTSVAYAVEMMKGAPIAVAGQNLFWEDEGAYTGEISASMLKSAGCSHVIIGHSERRQYFGETDDSVNRRINAALKGGLIPVVCIGETEAEREGGETFRVVEKQLKGALCGLSEERLKGFILAYEPVWAIGTGKVAEPEDAQEVHLFIRELLKQMYSGELSSETRILYGGSVKPENAGGILGQADVDGALVGGASLSAASFSAIAGAAVSLS